ncbi:hypothetical protein C5L14_07890 [Labrys okinawensis]|uniref:Uncharacterized protein n=1 Tax=Labrys okinawensis TaxID=346911 RepID=A0A2S9QEP2_9HYPH|nr:hypothetical protein [Labrys okinawensis]PRH87826.1 hypothetical protein C5L14_07890 [Labrys okinawensis]
MYAGLGAVLLGIGLYLQFGMAGVSPADRSHCEQAVEKVYGGSEETKSTLLPKCGEPGMVAMMDARTSGAGAEQAAQSIAAANRTGLVGILLNCALIGAGIGALGAAAATFRQSKKRAV